MSDNNITLAVNSNDTPVQVNFIHEIISCEKVTNLAQVHQELCHGIYAVLQGGAKLTDVEPLLYTMIEQSEDIAALLNHKKLIEEMGYPALSNAQTPTSTHD